jgi:hypothetical protein
MRIVSSRPDQALEEIDVNNHGPNQGLAASFIDQALKEPNMNNPRPTALGMRCLTPVHP